MIVVYPPPPSPPSRAVARNSSPLSEFQPARAYSAQSTSDPTQRAAGAGASAAPQLGTPYSDLVVGVLAERFPGEKRVAVTPQVLLLSGVYIVIDACGVSYVKRT